MEATAVNEPANPVCVERHGPVLEIRIDRPKANAIDSVTSRSLGSAFAAFRDDTSLRVAIVTGTGEKFFSAGWDLKAARGEEDNQDWGPGGFAGLTELFDLNKPVIAAINGMAVGAGLELALACDLIVAAEHAEFFLPEMALGIMADSGGVQRLPRRLPFFIAMDLLLTGRRMGAAEATYFGLVNNVVPSGDLMEKAHSLARDIAEKAPLAVAALKEIIRSTEHLSVEQAFAMTRSGPLPAYRRMLVSEDFREGPRAFAEKRKPSFVGR
jgi:crotonobetainyl-CoA hydratase